MPTTVSAHVLPCSCYSCLAPSLASVLSLPWGPPCPGLIPSIPALPFDPWLWLLTMDSSFTNGSSIWILPSGLTLGFGSWLLTMALTPAIRPAACSDHQVRPPCPGRLTNTGFADSSPFNILIFCANDTSYLNITYNLYWCRAFIRCRSIESVELQQSVAAYLLQNKRWVQFLWMSGSMSDWSHWGLLNFSMLLLISSWLCKEIHQLLGTTGWFPFNCTITLCLMTWDAKKDICSFTGSRNPVSFHWALYSHLPNEVVL